MKPTRKNFLIQFVLPTIITIVSFSTCAHAQRPASGKFTLLEEAHWGDAVLAQGEYIYSFDDTHKPLLVTVRQKDGAVVGTHNVDSSHGPWFVTVRREDGTVVGTFVPRKISKAPDSGSSEAVLKRVGKDMYVTSLESPGMVLTFSTRSTDEVKLNASVQSASPVSQ